jgi:hypothetical protein
MYILGNLGFTYGQAKGDIKGDKFPGKRRKRLSTSDFKNGAQAKGDKTSRLR